MLGLGGPEIFGIVVVVLVLFGGKKIPELFKGMGKGVKSFREGMEELDDDTQKKDTKDAEDKDPGA